MAKGADIALGTAQLGMPYGVANRRGQPRLEEAKVLLWRSMHNNIMLWDTSPSYGESERIIGQFVLESGIRPTILTKLPSIRKSGYQASQPHELDDLVEEKLNSSLDVLHLERVDYYLIHDEADYARYGSTIIRSLLRVKEKGLADRVGISVYSPSIAKRVLDTNTIDVIQLPLNLLDSRFMDSARLANAKGTVVLARSVFLQGLFFLEVEDLRQTHPEAVPYVQKLRKIASSAGRSVAEMAFCFVRDTPEIDAMIIGVESVDQLDFNLKLSECPPLSNELYTEIVATFKEIPTRVVDPSIWVGKR